ncbi:MAG: DUF4058 family protein [Prosthecobacter sp.]|nr:DUF4058 family protein [Prosthecobacter sp.]
MKLENPFPGMNPWLELGWENAHSTLLTYIKDAINEALPPDLRVRTEEGVTIGTADTDRDRPSRRRPDVSVIESWKQGVPPQWQPQEAGGTLLAEPDQIVAEEEIPPRWIEITDRTGRLITAIELLSPSNKGHERQEYKLRQHRYLESHVNLVEIDLLLCGSHTVAVSPDMLRPANGSVRYLVCVVRDSAPKQREIYHLPLRERLKPIRIPLRPADQDVILDLQPLIDRCYQTGRYWQTDYTRPLPQPLNAEDTAWATALLQQAELL